MKLIRKERIILGLPFLRILFASIVAALIIAKQYKIASVFFVVTGLTAFYESMQLKNYKKSLLRSFFDFFADRYLIDIVTVALFLRKEIPLWILLIFVMRDVLTFAIAFTLFWRDSRREFKPTILGKISIFLPILALLATLIENIRNYESNTNTLLWIAAIIVVVSGIESLFKSEFRFIKRKRELDEFRILRLLKFADVFTLTNVAFGVLSILFSISGTYWLAGVMMILSVVGDFFDGKIAKLMNQQNEFGKELDSLADTVSFGVAPAIFGFSLIQSPLALICFTVFLFCGILRLARYNIMDFKDFSGMPITTNGIIVPLAYFTARQLDLSFDFFPYLYLVLGILMVSSFRVKRLS